uniref:Retrovirus-related Pol polyprotein from transposon 17.6 n=1 Tax=Tanacetum cinerariifolium TaxID=118510 RepID=A0A6L2NJM4_TANCI|nr:retrovirus-related Pol polyprotein from transposon 17.6 [Tanacetum cinerariifolium]
MVQIKLGYKVPGEAISVLKQHRRPSQAKESILSMANEYDQPSSQDDLATKKVHPELFPKKWIKDDRGGRRTTATTHVNDVVELDSVQEAYKSLYLMTKQKEKASNMKGQPDEKKELFTLNIQVKQEVIEAIIDTGLFPKKWIKDDRGGRHTTATTHVNDVVELDSVQEAYKSLYLMTKQKEKASNMKGQPDEKKELFTLNIQKRGVDNSVPSASVGECIPSPASHTFTPNRQLRLNRKKCEFGKKQHEEMFLLLKSKISEAPVLALLNLQIPFELETDASGYAMGAVLYQKGRPIAYHSEMFQGTQKNYPTYDKELFALHQAVKHWHCYLPGKENVVHTDHQPLQYLKTQAKLQQARHMKWMTYLQHFNLVIKYIPQATMNMPLIILAIHIL